MKEFLAAHTVEAIGIIIAAITAIGVFVRPWVAGWRQRKNTEQDRKLRAHFEELKKEAQLIMTSAACVSVIIDDNAEVIVPTMGSYGQIITSIEEAQVSGSFEAHFREQAKEFNGLKQEIRKYNTTCEDFQRKIKVAFESKGIPVVQNDQGKLPVFIYEASLDALFNKWIGLALNKYPRSDFQKIGSSPVEGGYKIFTGGWGGSVTVFMFGKTEDERRKCELALVEIAGDVENQRRTAEILDSANRLTGKAEEFRHQLASEINSIDKFWPGKKTNEFKRLKKNCPDCKRLF